jgi:hypothetical protein
MATKLALNAKWGAMEPMAPSLFCYYFFGVFMAFLCVSQQGTRGVQKHHSIVFGEIHVKNFWPKKLRVEKKKPPSCRLFPSIFLNRLFFGRFST